MPAFFKERLRKYFGEAYANAAERGDVEAMKRHYFDTYEPQGLVDASAMLSQNLYPCLGRLLPFQQS
jgi:hypothetical protein